MMVAEYEEENSQSHAGDAPQDRYDDREPVRRAPVEKIGEGEGLEHSPHLPSASRILGTPATDGLSTAKHRVYRRPDRITP